jgi:hypothetical protein
MFKHLEFQSVTLLELGQQIRPEIEIRTGCPRYNPKSPLALGERGGGEGGAFTALAALVASGRRFGSEALHKKASPVEFRFPSSSLSMVMYTLVPLSRFYDIT